jgi:hypothetical protein
MIEPREIKFADHRTFNVWSCDLLTCIIASLFVFLDILSLLVAAGDSPLGAPRGQMFGWR